MSPGQVAGPAAFPASPARSAAPRAAARVHDRVPHAVARVHAEGTLPHEGIYDISREALVDFPAARDLALAVQLSGDAGLAERAARLVGAWAAEHRPSFNPIDETGFEARFIARDCFRLGSGSRSLPE